MVPRTQEHMDDKRTRLECIASLSPMHLSLPSCSSRTVALPANQHPFHLQPDRDSPFLTHRPLMKRSRLTFLRCESSILRDELPERGRRTLERAIAIVLPLADVARVREIALVAHVAASVTGEVGVLVDTESLGSSSIYASRRAAMQSRRWMYAPEGTQRTQLIHPEGCKLEVNAL